MRSNMRSNLPAWRHYLRGVLLLSMLTACGQQSGCSGCDEPGASSPFPSKDKVHSAVQIRVTRSGVDFLEQNLEPILAQALPENGLNFCLPGDGGDIIGLVEWGYCQDEACPEGGRGCNLTISIDAVDLEARPPDQIRAGVTFGDLSARIPLQADPVINCALTINGAGFEVGLPLILSTPAPTRELTFAVAGAPEYQLSALNIGLQGGGALGFICDAIGGVISFPFIGDLILDALQGLVDGLLVDQISALFEGFTCRPCEDDRACRVADGAVCIEGVCRNADQSCVPSTLGIEGLLDVGALLSGFSPGLDAKVAYHAVPGSYVAVENGGISMGMISGAISDRSRCVPVKPQPEIYEPLRTDLLRGNIDVNENDYAVGIGVTEELIGHFMWAIFNAGTLCLEITTDAVEQLNAGTLGIALPNLGTLARNRAAPIGITMAPQQLPNIRIGANTMVDDGEGNMVLDDPLLTIELDDLWLDFHTFMDDRWVRIFSLHTDVSIPFGLAFEPDNGLIPILGDIASGIGNISTANGEVMQDNPALIAGLLPVILNAFVGDLASGLAEPIALPDIMGFQLDLQNGSITGIEENTLLAIFAGLRAAPAPEEMVMVRFPVDTAVEVSEVSVPPTEAFAIRDADSWRIPFVRLALDAWQPGVDEPVMEYSWKVDQGSWTLFSPSTEITVRHPSFALQGKHTIQVRARRVDDYRTLDPTPASVEVIIDSVAPSLDVQRVDGSADRWRLVADDMVSGALGLRYEARWDGGPWVALDGPEVTVDGAAEAVEVRAIDEAGNSTEARIGVSRSGLIGRPDPAAVAVDGGCGGCAVGAESSGADAPWWLLGGILLFFGFGRRRPRGATSALMVLGLVALGGLIVGCDDEAASKPDPQNDSGVPPPECTADDGCPEGEVCQGGACVPLTCTDDPSVCDALDCGNRGATCDDGTCACLPFCPDGCADGQYCCEARNACEAPPAAACEALACPPGFEVGVVDDGMIDEASCERVDVGCDCVELDPLDPGFVGRFVDLTVHDRTAWISAYAEDYGDLVVARYDEVAGWVWQWVDGVPEGEVEGAPSGPRGGVEADGPNVGQYTSIAAGPDGSLHVAYHDVDNKALKYAYGAPRADGAHDWTTVVLDGDDAGRWASLSVDQNGAPAIAYRVGSVADGDGFVSQLRVIVAASASPTSADDWGAPFIVQTRALADQNPETGSYPEGTGLFNSLTRDPEGRLYVAWYDRSEGRLWWSTLVDAGWSAPEMLAGWGHPDPDRDGDMGANVDLFFDPQGNPHLCYQDGMTDSLRYLAPSLDRDEWVDDGVWVEVGGRPYSVHVVGDDCNVRVDRNGEPVIVFQDATLQALLMRRRTRPVQDPAVENPWSGREVLRGDEGNYQGAHGFYASAAVVDGDLWVVHYVYNNQVRPAVRRIELVVEPL